MDEMVTRCHSTVRLNGLGSLQGLLHPILDVLEGDRGKKSLERELTDAGKGELE